MNKVKLRQGKAEIIPLDKELFLEKTKRKPPYFQNHMLEYPLAVCPQCDNSVKVIGFYKDIIPKPYAKHHEESVKDLADFDEEAMRYCPYFDKRESVDKNERRSKNSEISRLVKTLLREQFDRIIYMLEKVTGVYISDSLADTMISSFAASECWDYSWLTANNLPWIFGYMQSAKELYGRNLYVNSVLYKAVSEKCKNVMLEPKGNKLAKLGSNGFLKLSYYFSNHNRTVVNGILNESVKLNVVQTIGGKDVCIVKETLYVDETWFLNLIMKKENDRFRNRKNLLSIAQKYV